MCEPTTLTALAIASTVASTGVAVYSADQQKKAVNASNETQRQAIHAAAIENYTQANRQGVEERENQTAEQAQIARERAARLSAATTSAAAGGVGGASVDAFMLDLAGKGLEASSTSESNYARATHALGDQVNNIGTSTRSQLASVRDQSRSLGLDALGAGLQVGTAYYSNQAKSQQRIKQS